VSADLRLPSELFNCERVNAYLESYLLGQIPPPERRGMRLHIHRCDVCFAKVTERDPLQLFAPLAEQERAPQNWAGFEERILAAIHERESATSHSFLRRRFMRVRLTPARAAVGLLALAAMVAAILVLPRLMTEKALAPAPMVAGATGTAEPPQSSGDPLPQTVEQVRTADSRPVQVYSMAWAAHDDGENTGAAESSVTELVLIVDAGIDL